MMGRPFLGALAAILISAIAWAQTFPGDGIGEVTLATPAAIASATINSNTQVLRVRSVVANEGCPLSYLRGSTSAGSQYGSVLNTESGIFWDPMFDNSPVRACQFGTVSDGIYNQATGAITGTDNYPMIQNALDYAMRNQFQIVCLSDGAYRTDDGLAIGWGHDLYVLGLRACNEGRGSYSFVNGPPGVSLFPTKTDRCAINFAGSRQGSIAGIQILGQNYVYLTGITSGGVSPTGFPWPWPSNPALWLATALRTNNPGGISQFTPYAAICIDAYGVDGSGGTTTPSPPYPAQTFPAWYLALHPGLGQYGQFPSSDITIENVLVQGFALGVNIRSWGDGNTDFMKVRNFSCNMTVYCGSVGNSQSRADIFESISCGNVYAILTNTKFGLGGELGGRLVNASCSQAFEMVDISTSLGGLTIQDAYMEAAVRIGVIAGAHSLTISNSTFTTESAFHGNMPVALIEAINGTTLTLDNVNIGNAARIMGIVHDASGAAGALTVRNSSLNGGQYVGTLFGGIAAHQQAVNYTGGYLAGALVYPNNPPFAKKLIWEGSGFGSFMATPNVPANSVGVTQTTWTKYPISVANVRLPLTQAMMGVIDGIDNKYYSFMHSPATFNFDTANFASAPVLSNGCDLWTVQHTAGQQSSQGAQLLPGDIYYHSATGTIWVIEAVGAQSGGNFPISFRQHNNMLVDTSANCTTNNLGTTFPTGDGLIIHTGVTIPTTVFNCDFIAGSNTVVNCTNGVNLGQGGTGMNTVFAVGDRFWTMASGERQKGFPFSGNASIASITQAGTNPGVLTITCPVAGNNCINQSGRFSLLPLPAAEAPGLAPQDSPLRYAGAVNSAPVTSPYSLPSCSGNMQGSRALVSDASAPTYRGAYTAGGALPAQVICVGGAWQTE